MKEKKYYQNKKNASSDLFLIWITGALIIAGLVMLSSASSVLAVQQFKDPYFYLKHQLLYGVLVGVVLCFLCSKISYRRWEILAVPFFCFSLILLILVFIPGVGVNYGGSYRWIKLGFFNFQPSELMKLALIFYLSAWFSKKQDKMGDFKKIVLPFLFILMVLAVIFIKQPDVGTFGILSGISLIIFFTAGGKIRHLTLIVSGGILGLWALIKAAPYRMNRFLVFLNPKIDPQGIGYQINQALIAIGSGGIFGLGLGYSRQKFNYLPEPIGDSIFAIISEEMGLIGGCVILILFGLFAWRGYRIAKKAPDRFGRLLATGITSWIIFQALINIAAITSLIPLTGVTLPFISYGSSSLIIILAGVGVLLNISKSSNSV